MKLLTQFLFKKSVSLIVFILFFLSFQETLSQTIPATNNNGASTAPCGDCVPLGWNDAGGTPDRSTATTAAGFNAGGGGGATWNFPAGSPANTLPNCPNGHTNWLSLRDIGGTVESVDATINGLTVGSTYEVIVYWLAPLSNNDGRFSDYYAGKRIDYFQYQLGANTPINVNVNGVYDQWVTERLRFVATNTSENFAFLPDNNSGGPTGTRINYETIQLSLTLNAINTAPVANNNNDTTFTGVPVSFNITNNDSDAEDTTVQTATVDLNPSTPAIDTSVSVPGEGTWTVDASGNVTFSPLAAFTGTATLPYTVQDNYMLDGTAVPATSNIAQLSVVVTVDPCDAAASCNLDTDGDGISDICDLDDDNDGILDTNECPDGSSPARAFCSLGEARVVSTAGVYFFNINGQAFSTYVDANGYVQVAIDFGNGVGNLPQGTSLTNSTRGILTPAVLATLTTATQIRISHSGGNFDVTSTNATLLSRVTTNTTLHRGVGDNSINNSWTGTNSTAITVNSTCTTGSGTSLHQNIAHLCGIGAGFHWIPSGNFQRIRFNAGANSGEIANGESFTLWVQAPATICDKDNDGIINSLDTDADNDGCPDAVEAAGSFLLTQLTTLAGGSNGAGSSLLNFGTTVNTTQGSANYGVPIQDANGLAIAANLPQDMAPAVLDNTINACHADLSLTKTVDKAIVKVGDAIIYTLTIKNDGLYIATGVQVTDVLPAGITYVSDNSATTSTTYTGNIWNVGNLNVNQTKSLQITATVSGAGTIVNTAQVTQSTQTDPDSTPNNGN